MVEATLKLGLFRQIFLSARLRKLGCFGFREPESNKCLLGWKPPESKTIWTKQFGQQGGQWVSLPAVTKRLTANDWVISVMIDAGTAGVARYRVLLDTDSGSWKDF